MAGAAIGGLIQYAAEGLTRRGDTTFSYKMPRNGGYTSRRRYSNKTYGVGKTRRRGNTMSGPVSKRDLVRMLNKRTGGFVGKELKFHDLTRNTNILADGAAVGLEVDPTPQFCLNSVVQGTGPTERIGRRIWMKSLQIQGHVGFSPEKGQVNPNIDHIVTIWVVLDTQTNQSAAQSEQVFTNAGIAALSPYLFRNMQNTDRFRVLKKKTIKMTADVSTDDTAVPAEFAHSGRRFPFKFWLPLNRMAVLFDPNSTLGTVSQIMDNSIHMMAATSDTGSVPFIDYVSRLRFYT